VCFSGVCFGGSRQILTIGNSKSESIVKISD